MTDPNIWLWLAGQFICGAAIWGGIRADIRSMHARMDDAHKNITEAHSRIDAILLERAK